MPEGQACVVAIEGVARVIETAKAKSWSALRARGLNLGCSAPDPWVAFFARAKKATKGLTQARFLRGSDIRTSLYIKKAAPDAALFFHSAALGPPLSHATPVAGDSRPRPVGDPSGFLPKPFGAQVRHRGCGRQRHPGQFPYCDLSVPFSVRSMVKDQFCKLF